MQPIMLALGLVLIIEGLGPLLFPQAWRRWLSQLASTEPALLRRIGGALVVAGGTIFYFFR
ncbi:DUF2065 domain-containing protein [Zobellella maritima]|uniref:DUF2065 domain-containing protein n=1 Tax=Zobellella maritima TaxID=2059725 RepID=UPI000E30AFE9|nr:DUF2065 domain-containing protein [Zobellella maritima]